jgi:hypothetical protein
MKNKQLTLIKILGIILSVLLTVSFMSATNPKEPDPVERCFVLRSCPNPEDFTEKPCAGRKREDCHGRANKPECAKGTFYTCGTPEDLRDDEICKVFPQGWDPESKCGFIEIGEQCAWNEETNRCESDIDNSECVNISCADDIECIKTD